MTYPEHPQVQQEQSLLCCQHIRTLEQVLSNQLFITISIFATKIDVLVFETGSIYAVQAGTEFQVFLLYLLSAGDHR